MLCKDANACQPLRSVLHFSFSFYSFFFLFSFLGFVTTRIGKVSNRFTVGTGMTSIKICRIYFQFGFSFFLSFTANTERVGIIRKICCSFSCWNDPVVTWKKFRGSTALRKLKVSGREVGSSGKLEVGPRILLNYSETGPLGIFGTDILVLGIAEGFVKSAIDSLKFPRLLDSKIKKFLYIFGLLPYTIKYIYVKN